MDFPSTPSYKKRQGIPHSSKGQVPIKRPIIIYQKLPYKTGK